jgi:hypothetical protein
MTEAEHHIAAKMQTDSAVTALMLWVAEAQKATVSDKLDGTARARIGELLINACRYLAEREAAAKKAQAKAEHDARPEMVALKHKYQQTQLRATGL